MSSALFPTLPGLAWSVTRRPMWTTLVQTARSGVETRASYDRAPRYRYALAFDVLRARTSAAALEELETLLGFYNARRGRLDSFLFRDPDDCAVAAHGFGVGDGATTAFQLQRTLAGARAADAFGPAAVATTPRTNFVAASRNLAGAGWSSDAAGVAAVAAAGPGPDGVLTATRLTQSAAGTANRYSTTAVSGLAAGVPVVASVWLRAASAGARAQIGLSRDTGQDATIAIVAPSAVWRRYSVVLAAGFSAAPSTLHLVAFPVANGDAIDVDAAQLEIGLAPTAFIATTTAPATVAPRYYPAADDGFEPVREIDYATPPTIAVAGVVQSPATAYTIDARGVVTFAAAPAAGAALTWGGAYFWRVRFDDDALDLEQFAAKLWRLGALSLVTLR